MLATYRQIAVMITAPAIEPIRPLGFEREAIARDQTRQQSTDERAAQAGNERDRPIDRAALPPEDELGECADEDAETEDGENEHGRTISP